MSHPSSKSSENKKKFRLDCRSSLLSLAISQTRLRTGFQRLSMTTTRRFSFSDYQNNSNIRWIQRTPKDYGTIKLYAAMTRRLYGNTVLRKRLSLLAVVRYKKLCGRAVLRKDFVCCVKKKSFCTCCVKMKTLCRSCFKKNTLCTVGAVLR